VCDHAPERLTAAAQRWPNVRGTSQADELIDAPEVAVVSIASYDDDHFSQAVRALRAGKHVFVEKPLCRTQDELRELAAAQAASGRCLASNLVLRAAPLFRWLQSEIRNGELGRVYSFDGEYLYGRLHKITGGWRKDVPRYSVMLGGGIHLVDLLLWTTGERPTSVTASGNRMSTEGTAFRYLDHAAATFEFPSGMVGRVTANFGAVHWHQHVVRVFGTQATLIVDDQGPRLHESREEPARPLGLSALPETKGDLIPAFVSAIVAGSPQRAQHEFDVISACLAADEALIQGGKVDIDYV
jgi:predicted dehydrogenase